MPIKCFLIEPIYGDGDIGYEAFDRRPIVGWVRSDTGERHERNCEFGAGAMWFATWYGPKYSEWQNQAGPPLIVRCPGERDWNIDSRCSNCGLPDDRLHRCWVRHGEPPNITVDKAGVTCSAGAGSIVLPNWHGFLRNGELVVA
jgi:hypothetical protein